MSGGLDRAAQRKDVLAVVAATGDLVKASKMAGVPQEDVQADILADPEMAAAFRAAVSRYNSANGLPSGTPPYLGLYPVDVTAFPSGETLVMEELLMGRRVTTDEWCRERAKASAEQTVSIFESLQEPESKPVYRIDGVLVADALMQLSSDPGVGKTGLLIGAALHLAAGHDFLGMRIPEPVPVLFWQAEGSRASFKIRVETAAANYGIVLDGLPLSIPKKSLRPSDFGSQEFRQIVERSGAKVVIADTRRFFAPRANENDATDFMNMVVSPLKGIAADLQVAFITTTHFGKPNENRVGAHKTRGSSAQQGDFDVLARLEAPNGKAAPERAIEWDKIRDEEERAPINLIFQKDRHVFALNEADPSSIRPSREMRAKAKQAAKDESDRKAKEALGLLLRRSEGMTVTELAKASGRRQSWVATVVDEFHAAGLVVHETVRRPDANGRRLPVMVWKWKV